ncbi:MAG: hypothetical protein CO094_03290 [Anaerolineae bacterium CG_4_9_14_3_um_filter_57_17]|nr:Hpt domain-containing protein [bacterium]NCT20679.1 Hpt domain-containing protein [bacterium]OIO86152.1 MAG: hypothetical protein AUK01_04255 [Anaerolineae bacterium CG2_30_57_67]PJB67672.1 MAG: hypothetical protein CO094_03290 [Anaerolineae bacterium CG_4_9_14_3_um_filter_57_17]
MNHIDPNALDPYREMMGDEADAFVADILNTYLSNSNQLVNSIETCFASGDIATFTRAAHTLKGNSAMFGAQTLTGLALQLEQAGKTNHLENLQPIIAQLKVEYEIVRQELTELRRTLPG